MPALPEAQSGKHENIYALSTSNILNNATLIAAFSWNTSKHIAVARESGYQGVELWPQRMRGRRFKAGRLAHLSDIEKTGITSIHQSVARAGDQSLRGKQIALFLPEETASLKDLREIKQYLGDIPVVFMEAPQSFLQETGFSQRGIQTSPELCDAIGATNAEEFVEKIKLMGFSHVVIDTHHIRRPHIKTGKPNPLRDWRSSLPILLPHTKELHIGVGRTDFGNIPAEQTRDELDDLLTGGQKNTEIVQMLRMIGESGWNGLVVVEMRPNELPGKNHFGQLPKRTLIAHYEKIKQTIDQVLAQQ